MSKFKFGDKVTHPVHGDGIFLRLWPKDNKFYDCDLYPFDYCSVSFALLPNDDELTQWIKVDDLTLVDEKIKLHPMSEKPSRGAERIYEISELYEPWRESVYMIQAYHGGWERYAIRAEHKFKKIGWLYESELSQLIKNNTAP